jgi:hypothetical protein
LHLIHNLHLKSAIESTFNEIGARVSWLEIKSFGLLFAFDVAGLAYFGQLMILAQILVAKCKALQIILQSIFFIAQMLILAPSIVEGGAHDLNEFIKFFVFFICLGILFRFKQNT